MALNFKPGDRVVMTGYPCRVGTIMPESQHKFIGEGHTEVLWDYYEKLPDPFPFNERSWRKFTERSQTVIPRLDRLRMATDQDERCCQAYVEQHTETIIVSKEDMEK